MRGETLSTATIKQCIKQFQSTPLMRGETLEAAHIPVDRGISIHSPHARGDWSRFTRPHRISVDFNPLPSCEGRHSEDYERLLTKIFQSTPLMRGETFIGISFCPLRDISIHSPHARGDCGKRIFPARRRHFNPLPSCEGRQHKPLKILLDSRQSIQQKHHSSFF